MSFYYFNYYDYYANETDENKLSLGWEIGGIGAARDFDVVCYY